MTVYSPYGVARLYAGKLPSCRGDEKDRPLSSFLDKRNKADGKQKRNSEKAQATV